MQKCCENGETNSLRMCRGLQWIYTHLQQEEDSRVFITGENSKTPPRNSAAYDPIFAEQCFKYSHSITVIHFITDAFHYTGMFQYCSDGCLYILIGSKWLKEHLNCSSKRNSDMTEGKTKCSIDFGRANN